jgi:hypothetical protein
MCISPEKTHLLRLLGANLLITTVAALLLASTPYTLLNGNGYLPFADDYDSAL